MSLLFENKVSINRGDFLSKVKDLAAKLGIVPDWLMIVMNSESNFDAQAVNKQPASIPGKDENGQLVKPKGVPDSSNEYERARYRATGLIQFMPATAKGLKTSTQALYKMTNVQQLDYVYQYFLPYKGKIKSFEDLYIITFYPHADGKFGGTLEKADSWTFPSAVYQFNKALDIDGDGKISIADFKKFAAKKVPAALLEQLKKLKTEVVTHKSEIGTGIAIIAIAGIAYANRKRITQFFNTI